MLLTDMWVMLKMSLWNLFWQILVRIRQIHTFNLRQQQYTVWGNDLNNNNNFLDMFEKTAASQGPAKKKM